MDPADIIIIHNYQEKPFSHFACPGSKLYVFTWTEEDPGRQNNSLLGLHVETALVHVVPK